MAFNIPWSAGGFSSSGGGGGTTPATAVNISPVESVVNTSGNTTAGIQRLSVFNSGGANGTFNGITLFPGTGREYEAYLDPVTNEFKRIAAMAYDATGTTFDISETP